jgi:hydrogenase maturation protein HypF
MVFACLIRVRGIVQGVGFRPFVYRLAGTYKITGWVLNGPDGVAIHAEGTEQELSGFLHDFRHTAPPAAHVSEVEISAADPGRFPEFSIRESERNVSPTVRISPDLPICDDCRAELFDSSNPRYRYPYINCTNCGPRYSVILSLPYDRPHTTMKAWPLDQLCENEYQDPGDRRFHAQPVACPQCGPGYFLQQGGRLSGDAAIERTAELLREGAIVAVKGLGGYHLACDARNVTAVENLRERKFRKEKPFALMAKDLATARSLIELSPAAEALLSSNARPIVLARAKSSFTGVAPENNELGVMLPCTPLQFLLFDAGAPDVLVMTSANRSSEPIAYEDQDALDHLQQIADAFLIGERPIARRVDDSVARAGSFGPVILRRSRGYAPAAVATLPRNHPLLAVGADLKNTITLVVEGQAFVSQHIGDLSHYQASRAFQETVNDLIAMYEVDWDDVLVLHDAHPQYVSTQFALNLPAGKRVAVQHHRAHIASVLAEKQAWEKRVLGVSFDGTGFGDDETIWGGEFFVGSLVEGFTRVAHLRPAALPGGDAAVEFPPQAAAGFLSQLDHLPDLLASPFRFPTRYRNAAKLIQHDVRNFSTTSMGRLFDSAAALIGFTREISFEGQAAMWLEHVASADPDTEAYPFPFEDNELDFRPLLLSVIQHRLSGHPPSKIARAFQRGIAGGLHNAAQHLCRRQGIDTVVLSGGVFQNELLMADLAGLFAGTDLRIWTNQSVPPNDGGISLGQAALGAFAVKQEGKRNAQSESLITA